MKQEDKELLLKDLCARLPYGVKCYDFYYDNSGNKVDDVCTLETINPTHRIYKYVGINNEHDISRIKPYLRPMSSMTEWEKKECCAIFNNCMYQFEVDKYGDIRSTKETVERENIYYDIELMDEWMKWLNAHHFDFRNLISKRLALEAPEGMYKN